MSNFHEDERAAIFELLDAARGRVDPRTLKIVHGLVDTLVRRDQAERDHPNQRRFRRQLDALVRILVAPEVTKVGIERRQLLAWVDVTSDMLSGGPLRPSPGGPRLKLPGSTVGRMLSASGPSEGRPARLQPTPSSIDYYMYVYLSTEDIDSGLDFLTALHVVLRDLGAGIVVPEPPVIGSILQKIGLGRAKGVATKLKDGVGSAIVGKPQAEAHQLHNDATAKLVTLATEFDDVIIEGDGELIMKTTSGEGKRTLRVMKLTEDLRRLVEADNAALLRHPGRLAETLDRALPPPRPEDRRG